MDIGINILPKEMRAKPLLDIPTFALIVIILLLAFGSFYYYHAKSSSQNDIADMRSQITTMQQQTLAASNNPQALSLINSISQLKAAKQGYDAFTASKMQLGYSLVGVYALVPAGVGIDTITQGGNTLVIKGTAPTYTEVSDYGRDLNNDPRFSLVGLPSFAEGKFSLTVIVVQGGG
jgi:Tfp pilus assembly protein PilN